MLSWIRFVVKSNIIVIKGNWILTIRDMGYQKNVMLPREIPIYFICKNIGIVHIWRHEEEESVSVKFWFIFCFWLKPVAFFWLDDRCKTIISRVNYCGRASIGGRVQLIKCRYNGFNSGWLMQCSICR